MPVPKIFESEYRFCLILWEQGPIRSMELLGEYDIRTQERRSHEHLCVYQAGAVHQQGTGG